MTTLRGSTLLYKDIVDKIVNNNNYNKKFFDEVESRIGISLKFIRDYLGDGQTIEFLDILSGDKIQFPTSKELKDLIFGVQVYLYYESLGKDEVNISYVAKKFGQTISNTRKFITLFDKDYDRDKEKTFGEIYDENEYEEEEYFNEDEKIDDFDEEDWLDYSEDFDEDD